MRIAIANNLQLPTGAEGSLDNTQLTAIIKAAVESAIPGTVVELYSLTTGEPPTLLVRRRDSAPPAQDDAPAGIGQPEGPVKP